MLKDKNFKYHLIFFLEHFFALSPFSSPIQAADVFLFFNSKKGLNFIKQKKVLFLTCIFQKHNPLGK